MSRPFPLGGFWALLLGGVLLAATVVLAHPVLDPAACPNAGAAGNASAFADPAWDFRLPLLMLGWVVVVAIEQFLPATWRHRARPAVAVRAATALSAVFLASCFALVPLLTMCR